MEERNHSWKYRQGKDQPYPSALLTQTTEPTISHDYSTQSQDIDDSTSWEYDTATIDSSQVGSEQLDSMRTPIFSYLNVGTASDTITDTMGGYVTMDRSYSTGSNWTFADGSQQTYYLAPGDPLVEASVDIEAIEPDNGQFPAGPIDYRQIFLPDLGSKSTCHSSLPTQHREVTDGASTTNRV